MDEAQARDLQHKEVLYRQMVDLYPSEAKYLKRLIELLLQQDKDKEALEKMRQLERLYCQQGLKDEAHSLNALRKSITGRDTELHTTLNPFLSGITPEALNLLMRNAERIRLKEGQLLIRQGETDDAMYIVLEGELAVLVRYQKQSNPSIVHLLSEGEIVGETAFLEGKARSASVVANSKTSVLKLAPKRVLQCLLKFPDVSRNLRWESEFRKTLTIIHSNTILAKLPAEAKAELASHAKTRHYPAFSVISRSRKNPAWMGILASGLIRIVAEDRMGHSHLLEPIKAGDTIAEVAVLREEALMADMISVNDAEVVQIPAGVFKQVMHDNPTIRNKLLDKAADRIASTMHYIKNKGDR